MLTKKKDYKFLILLFLVSRLVCVAITFIGKGYTECLQLFDGEWYINIAENGYFNTSTYCFFPVLPLLIRYIGKAGAITVNQSAFLGSMFLLYSLVEKSKSCKFALILFAFSPVSFFSIILYTESLFFFFTIASYWMFANRKFGIVTGILLGLSVATRNSGSMLFFAMFIGMCYLWYKRETGFLKIVLTYVPATVISVLYPLYLQLEKGSWKLFIDSQYTNWGRGKVWPLEFIKYEIALFKDPTLEPDEILLFALNEIFSIAILGFIIYLLIMKLIPYLKKKEINVDYLVNAIYLLGSIFAFNLTIRVVPHAAPMTSFYRYYLGLFPLYIYVCDFAKTRNKRSISLFCFFALFIITSSLFSCGCYFF